MVAECDQLCSCFEFLLLSDHCYGCWINLEYDVWLRIDTVILKFYKQEGNSAWLYLSSLPVYNACTINLECPLYEMVENMHQSFYCEAHC